MMTENTGEDESMLIMLIQQYASRFGVTFSSTLMDNEAYKARLMSLMVEAINGKRGAVTDEDVIND